MASKKNRARNRPARSTDSKHPPRKTAQGKAGSAARAVTAARRPHQGGGLSTNLKLTIGLVILAIVALGGIIYATGKSEPSDSEAQERLIRSDSHILNQAEDKAATLVEFLDFECEACGALYPAMEQIRDAYQDRITFVVRYFPLQGHTNGELAARAVESAAAQGKFEEMYQKMYETQSQWGEQQTSQEEAFIGFAEELGLDPDKFKSTLDDPATAERVTKDIEDGTALGVDSTPTLFLNGERIEARDFESLKSAIDDALAAA